MLRKSGGQREEIYPGEPELKLSNAHEQIYDYINFLRSQIRHIGSQIDFEFERSSEFIFRYICPLRSLYKHLYSPTQCPGEKSTLLNSTILAS
jgi:hypothetical protein